MKRIQPNSHDSDPLHSHGTDQMTYKKERLSLAGIVLVFLLIILPVSAHAGFFSAFLHFLSESTPEDEPVTLIASAQSVDLLKAAFNADPNPSVGGGDIIIDEGALIPQAFTDDGGEISHTSNGEISIYEVKPDDTLSEIAEMFDVSVNTILWANDISNAGVIQPGDSLIILPITGVRHVVKDGDTISTIAEKYEGDVDEILSYNQLASADAISIGDTIVIPGGAAESQTTSYAAVVPVRTSGDSTGSTGSGGGGYYMNPIPGSIKTQGLHGYNGVDLAAPVGTPIRAAASGEVIVSKNSGWNGGYGNYLVIRHPNGTQTLYAHNSRNVVGAGATVNAGETIAYVGVTGRSTGAHVHFEVRGARNPF